MSSLAAVAGEPDEPPEKGWTFGTVAECENHQVARILPVRYTVAQPKELGPIPQQKGSIRSREAMLFDIQSKVRPQRVNPSTSIRLHVS